MPHKSKGKQGWLDWSSDEEDSGRGDGSGGGSGSGSGKKGGHGGKGGNKGHVQGLDSMLARPHGGGGDQGGRPRGPAFALRADGDVSGSGRSDRRGGRRGRGSSPGGGTSATGLGGGRSVDARHPGFAPRPRATATGSGSCPPELLEMFGGALSRDTLDDVFEQCGRSVDAALEALLALSVGGDGDRGGGSGGERSSADQRTSSRSPTAGEAPRASPSGPRLAPERGADRAPDSETGPDLWDALPPELRLLILDRLGAREAARAARVCKDLAETVRGWRATKRDLVLPPTLSLAGLASLAAAYPALTSLSLRKCAPKMASSEDVLRVLRRGGDPKTDPSACDPIACDPNKPYCLSCRP